MKRKELTKIMKEPLEIIKISSRNILSESNEEDVHKLRVGFKKVRAFIRLVSAADSTNRKELLKELKELYAAAGTLRDLQIYRSYLSSYLGATEMPNAEYLQRLSQRTEQAGNKLRSTIESFSFNIVSDGLLKTIPGKLPRSMIGRFIRKQATSIKKHLQDVPGDEDIHEIRKHLKDVGYNIVHLGKKRARQIISRRKQKKIERTSDLLGDYHNNSMICAKLREAAFEPLQANEKEIIQRLKRKKKYQKRLLKERVLHQLLVLKYETLPAVLN